jgi:hypothetical protein
MAASHSLEDVGPIRTHLQCHIFALVALPYHGDCYDCRLLYDRIVFQLCKRGGMRAPGLNVHMLRWPYLGAVTMLARI